MVLNKIDSQWLNILAYPGVANQDEIFKQKAFGTGPTLPDCNDFGLGKTLRKGVFERWTATEIGLTHL